jgi:hypothetical protein
MPSVRDDQSGRQGRKSVQPVMRIEGMKPTASEEGRAKDQAPGARGGNEMSNHPTSKARRRRQKLKRQYARLREDCQLEGIIETTPSDALRDERTPVAPDPPFPHLVRQALREGWDVPNASKPKVVGDLLAAFYDREADPALLVRLARLLLLLDQLQYDINHPEHARKGRRRREEEASR